MTHWRAWDSGTTESDEALVPGSLPWFFWFLCSRWGKSAAEIANLSSREFLAHYEFWKQFKWGLTDDQLAMLNRLTMRSSTISTNWQFKEFALSDCGFVAPKVQSPEDLWSSIDATFASGYPLP